MSLFKKETPEQQAAREAAARTGVNPQTRAKIQVPAKQRVRFSPGKELSKAVAK